MKLHAVFVASLLAGLASAQFSGLPKCADSCVVDSIPESCNLNPSCICKATSFISAITCCVSKACSKADQEKTIKYANSVCNPVGVTNLPTAATCAAGQTNGTVAATGSSTRTGSTGTMSTTSMTSGTTSGSQTSAASGTNSGSQTNTASGASTTSTAGTTSATSTTASATANVGAGVWVQGFGVVGAAVVGAAALM